MMVLLSGSRLVILPPTEKPFRTSSSIFMQVTGSTILASRWVMPSASTSHLMALPAAMGWCISRMAPNFM